MKIAVVKFNCGHADMKDGGEERKGKGRGKDAQKKCKFLQTVNNNRRSPRSSGAQSKLKKATAEQKEKQKQKEEEEEKTKIENNSQRKCIKFAQEVLKLCTRRMQL